MSSDRPDDALSWGDEADASYVDPGRDELDDLDPDERSAGGSGAGADGDADPALAAGRAPGDRRRTAITLATGILAGVYLMYSVGWILGIQLLSLTGPTLLIEIMYQFGEFLAIIASALWFATTIALTRDGRPAARLGWLALGTLVLVPWPFLLGVLA
ncbi:hypothetical protein OVN18_01880 [Microcella daejeonensis]|uniref:DNA polymerase III subunit gamma/tau n=1 Tax=Microcella daejeonensis TaxID=2994971 RepID=A0A9E8MLG5_9MICO|nr:hypothetical protein [Microcella daejeonensis]WAB81793.1 hypothetical protein OVN18_01880 [Microcella daejeonensis]